MTMRTIYATALTLTLVGPSACDQDHRTPDARSDRSAKVDETAAQPVDALQTSEVSEAEGPASMPEAWTPWLKSELARLATARPELVGLVDSMRPVTTRAGFPRFTAPQLGQADALPLLLDRIAHGDDPPEVRAALIEALPGTGGDFGPAAMELLGQEPQAQVRAAWMHALRHIDGDAGLQGLSRGLADRDASVRAHAARMLSHRPDGSALATELIEATRDPVDDVRIAATRTLGALRVSEAGDALAALLEAENPEVQLHGLKALERVAPERAHQAGRLATLQGSDDPRLSRLATRLSSQ